jgi:hypothetical protein
MEIDRKSPRRASDAHSLGQTREDARDQLHSGALAVNDRAVGRSIYRNV